MTLQDYITAVQKEVDDSSSQALAIINRSVLDTYNECIEEVNAFIDTSVTEDFTAVVGQTAYPVSQDVNIYHQVAYCPTSTINFRVLHQITLEDFKNFYINRPAALPVEWFLDGDIPNVAPKPSEAGTVRVVYTPNFENVLVTSTSVIPERYMRTIIDGAIFRFKAWENNLASAQFYEGLYLQGKRKMFLALSTKGKVIRPKMYGKI